MSAVNGNVTLLVGTRKGAFFLRADKSRQNWQVSEPLFLGHIIFHFLRDVKDKNTYLIAAKTGHLGPTIFRSTDAGHTWSEASQLPAFAKVPEGEAGRVVEHTFWLTSASHIEPGLWYAGTSPPGLFSSPDHGDTWEPVLGFNENPMYGQWTGPGGTPDGPIVHSVLVDPRNANHIYVGISSGGVFETNDCGASWQPLNKGCAADFLPDPDAEFGHDPHCVTMHPLMLDRLYQQNHCGIYRLDRPSQEWVRIGKNMPAEIGDVGFPIVMHPRDPNCAWVFPMDGTDVWPRTSPGGKPAAYITRDAGASWQRQDKGLPERDAYLTVKRQAMTADSQDSLGLYFGTTGGEIWGSVDEGESWQCLVRHLPEIYSVTAI